MQYSFSKYHGTGNDFIMIDNRESIFDSKATELVKKLCNRRFGIGADGLILLENKEGYDFFMRYYNSDGKPSSMCGNGGRCIVAFAKQLGIINHKTLFYAPDGEHIASITKQGVSLKMCDVEAIEKINNDYYLDTGSPHYVRLIDSHDDWDTFSEGKKIRYSERFHKVGTNVNFISFLAGEKYRVSTYERGVEDETYSCGTGVVASSIVAGLLNGKTEQHILTKGGNLKVSYQKEGNSFTNILLEGVAVKAFDGTFDTVSFQ